MDIEGEASRGVLLADGWKARYESEGPLIYVEFSGLCCGGLLVDGWEARYESGGLLMYAGVTVFCCWMLFADGWVARKDFDGPFVYLLLATVVGKEAACGSLEYGGGGASVIVSYLRRLKICSSVF